MNPRRAPPPHETPANAGVFLRPYHRLRRKKPQFEGSFSMHDRHHEGGRRKRLRSIAAAVPMPLAS